MEYRGQRTDDRWQSADGRWQSRELEFKHFVVDSSGLIFACARDSANRIYNYIINTSTGTVLEQVNSHFECIIGDYAEQVKRTAERYYGVIPTYRIPQFELS
jgi:hypothetical protein